MYFLDRMKEIKNSQSIHNEFKIIPTQCDYCNRKIYAVWDEHNIRDWNPYIGTMAVQQSRYKYSEVINKIRSGLNITVHNIKPEDLMCTNARIHSEPASDEIRFNKESGRVLCVDCFRKTFNRVKFNGIPQKEYYGEELNYQRLFSASVVKEFGETVEQVAKDNHIDFVSLIGKGRIEEYN